MIEGAVWLIPRSFGPYESMQEKYGQALYPFP